MQAENTYMVGTNKKEDGIAGRIRRGLIEFSGISPVAERPAGEEVKSYNMMFVRNAYHPRHR